MNEFYEYSGGNPVNGSPMSQDPYYSQTMPDNQVVNGSSVLAGEAVKSSTVLYGSDLFFTMDHGPSTPTMLTNATSTDSYCTFVTFMLYGPVYGTICLCGLIGNALSFAVLHGVVANRKSVSTFLLKALAITDNLFLIFASMAQMFPAMAIYSQQQSQLEPYFRYIQTIIWPFTHITQMETTWMTVLVAVNRFIAVCKPLRAQSLCSMRKVKLQIIIMTIAVVTYNLPRFFEYRFVKVETVQTINDTNHTVMITAEENIGLSTIYLYNIIYESISYLVFVFLSPLVMLIFVNFHLVRELNRAKRCRQAMTTRQAKEENNITLVMIIIIIMYIVCQAPACINQILWVTLEDELKQECSPYSYFFHTSNLLITMNSSVNFVIYCVFRRQFRQQLLGRCHSRKKPRGRIQFRQTSQSTYESELTTPVTAVNNFGDQASKDLLKNQGLYD